MSFAMKLYQGSLGPKAGKRVARAMSTFCKQVGRCTNKNDHSYERYGARGIRVEYSSREFVAWYLDHMPENARPREFHVGRINHDGNYCLENIAIQSASENSREVHDRHKHIIAKNMTNRAATKSVDIYLKSSREFLSTVPSIKMAAELTNNWNESVCLCCKGKTKSTRNGFVFRYTGEKILWD